jgi:peptide/nickel transport system substrate-binding protein
MRVTPPEIVKVAGLSAALLVAMTSGMSAQPFIDAPSLLPEVEARRLPPLEERLPETPRKIVIDGPGLATGRHGGTLRLLMGDTRDIRMMTIYGYTRLVVFDQKLELKADILERVDVEAERIFTLRLRPGHRWSDGAPFTAEDFRYYWDDVANNPRLSPGGPPQTMIVNGKKPRFEVIDPQTVRYTWDQPNPVFLPALAGAQPLYIYMPAHYLKQVHQRYADPLQLQQRIKALRVRDWGALHERLSRQYRPENPNLPTLEPWRNTTALPAELFVFKRNPYFHRIDQNGRQLPYIDEVKMLIGTGSLIPAKAGAGESDLQARYLRFENYTFLKEASKRQDFDVRLWKRAEGAHCALFPNFNVMDPVWRKLLRDVRFRRALSVAINRRDINRVIFFGLAKESANTALPESPLYQSSLAEAWTAYNPTLANQMLDEIGLTERAPDGIRLLPDGRRLEFTIETAGESTEETDILELVAHDLLKVGMKVFVRSSQRDVFRRRITAGQTIMSAWGGLDNALVGPDMEPDGLAPTSGAQLNWPRWGQYFESGGREGERPDMPEVAQLITLYNSWRYSESRTERIDIWRRMLQLNADQAFTIGIVNSTLQPVVVSRRLRNVPEKGLYSFEPGAFFGIYMPDTFWFDDKPQVN